MQVASVTSRFKSSVLPLAGFATLMLVTFVFAYRTILRYTLTGYGDTPPFLTSDNALSFFISAWSPYSLGHFEYAGPWVLLQYITGILFGNLGQYIFMISLAPLSGIFQYIFVGQFRVGAIPRYTASFIYALNVFVVQSFQGGGVAILFAYAVIPIFALFALRFLREMNITNFLLLCISSGIVYFAHPHFLALMVPVVFVFWIVELWRRRSTRYLVSSIIAGGLWGAITLLLYLPYYGNLSFFSQLFSTAFAPTNSQGVTLSVGLADFAWPYRNAWGFFPSFLSFFNLIGLHYVLFPVALMSILLTTGRRKEYAIGFAFLIVGIILFIWYTALQLTYPLFLRFTVLNIFEGPNKLIALLMFAASLLVSFTLDEIIRRLSGVFGWRRLSPAWKPLSLWKHLPAALKLLAVGWKHMSLWERLSGWRRLPPGWEKRLVPSIIALTLIALFLIPLYGTLAAGDMGLISGYHGDSFATPSSFYVLKSWLDARHSQEGFFRTLWLPQGPETIYPAFSIDPWSFDLQVDSIRFRQPSVGFVNTVLSHLVANDTDNISELLGMGGVKYVIVDLTHSQQTGDPRIILWTDTYLAVGDPMEFVGLLSKQVGLSRIYTNDNFVDDNIAIFQNRLFIPHVSLYQDIPIEKNYTDIIQFKNATDNLIDNPSFENGLVHWNTFLNTEITAESKDAHSPNYAAQLNNTRSPQGGWSVLWRTLPVVGGATYNISLWLKTENVNATHVKLVYYSNWNATREDQAILETHLSGDIYGSNNWFEVSYVGKAPKAAVRMDFEVLGGWPLAGSLPGITWVDDVRIYRGYFHANIPSTIGPEPTVDKVSETQYQIKLPPHVPLFLVLYETYDSNWVATSPGSVETSIRAFGWANGFTIPSSSTDTIVTLNFKIEDARTLAVQAWALLWTLLVGGAIANEMFQSRRALWHIVTKTSEVVASRISVQSLRKPGSVLSRLRRILAKRLLRSLS